MKTSALLAILLSACSVYEEQGLDLIQLVEQAGDCGAQQPVAKLAHLCGGQAPLYEQVDGPTQFIECRSGTTASFDHVRGRGVASVEGDGCASTYELVRE